MIIKTSFGEYHVGGIYRHYEGKHYKIVSVSFLFRASNIYLINYHQCDVNGVYETIRTNMGLPNEVIIHQPFATHETEWNEELVINGVKQKRFELVKPNRL